MSERISSRTPVSTIGRRALVSSLLLVLSMVLGGTRQASAEIEWCRVDPVITVNGETYNIILASPDEILEYASGPTEVIVTVPAGSTYELISTDAGFGFGETVEFVEAPSRDDDEFVVTVKVPSKRGLPVLVEVFEGEEMLASALGKTNQRLSVVVPV